MRYSKAFSLGSSGATYRLHDAEIVVSGAADLAFSSNDCLEQTSARFDLPVGEYDIALSGDWYLERDETGEIFWRDIPRHFREKPLRGISW